MNPAAILFLRRYSGMVEAIVGIVNEQQRTNRFVMEAATGKPYPVRGFVAADVLAAAEKGGPDVLVAPLALLEEQMWDVRLALGHIVAITLPE